MLIKNGHVAIEFGYTTTQMLSQHLRAVGTELITSGSNAVLEFEVKTPPTSSLEHSDYENLVNHLSGIHALVIWDSTVSKKLQQHGVNPSEVHVNNKRFGKVILKVLSVDYSQGTVRFVFR